MLTVSCVGLSSLFVEILVLYLWKVKILFLFIVLLISIRSAHNLVF